MTQPRSTAHHRIPPLWLLAALALSVNAAAQDLPDFSGEWVLQSSSAPDPRTAAALTVRQSFQRQLRFGTSFDPPLIAIIVERRFTGGSSDSARYVVATAGGVSGLSGLQDSSTRVLTWWDEERLVIDTSEFSGSTPDPFRAAARTEEWMLGQDALVITVTDRGPGKTPSTTTLTYRRSTVGR